MDRNDELLLALGWGVNNACCWTTPDGKPAGPALPRPYDNLQDAEDCVPPEYGYFLDTVGDQPGAQLFKKGDPKRWPVTDWCYAPKSSEALAEAISKAVSKEAGK